MLYKMHTHSKYKHPFLKKSKKKKKKFARKVSPQTVAPWSPKIASLPLMVAYTYNPGCVCVCVCLMIMLIWNKTLVSGYSSGYFGSCINKQLAQDRTTDLRIWPSRMLGNTSQGTVHVMSAKQSRMLP